MSYDIFVFDMPPEAKRVEDIPADYAARPLGPRSRILDVIRSVSPGIEFDAAGWGSLAMREKRSPAGRRIETL